MPSKDNVARGLAHKAKQQSKLSESDVLKIYGRIAELTEQIGALSTRLNVLEKIVQEKMV